MSTKQLSCDDLAIVTGAGVWDALDNGLNAIPGNHGWKEEPCAARGSWVGWGYGAVTSLAGAYALKKGKPLTMWAIGTAAGAGGSKIYSSYINNCEAQKAAAAKK